MISQDDCNGCHTCEVACKQEHGLRVGPRVVKVMERAPLFVQYFATTAKMHPVRCPVRKTPL